MHWHNSQECFGLVAVHCSTICSVVHLQCPCTCCKFLHCCAAGLEPEFQTLTFDETESRLSKARAAGQAAFESDDVPDTDGDDLLDLLDSVS